MAVQRKKNDFFESEEGAVIVRTLELMAKDATYNTTSSYSANSVLYPDNLIPFVDKHLNYLRTHPTTNPHYYVANLRLMTRIK